MDMTILIVVVICTAVLVDMVWSVMMVVMAMAAEVNVVCLAAQSAQQEPTTQTGLHNVTGAISLANAGPGTARADFFILLSDMPGLDAGGRGGDSPSGTVGRGRRGRSRARGASASGAPPAWERRRGGGRIRGCGRDRRVRGVAAGRSSHDATGDGSFRGRRPRDGRARMAGGALASVLLPAW